MDGIKGVNFPFILMRNIYYFNTTLICLKKLSYVMLMMLCEGPAANNLVFISFSPLHEN